ncbi:T-complex protein 11 homolog [Prionailurus bengalensis]|uniref:T-complex protein 11 homolog n=1 Tax=Prionailurus bengalensis TaxID=37029 RepID=UPI001CA8D441|nr:T-complex protein 11 homolog [Prionailurus bengalensis]XP_043447164.1 T-complex protein 11 homolog [Prionailurus bengalensis]XP_043447165.1 T-complex protein 11 homolog [Prionailurus bengalensis]XP_043447166.1 T-complex protein 11 homolog [Prionailurus bengalensis]XP_043447168.1 T-complex protein 11 homolog [Prionailurus bengalensis]XP_043447169.1 T-complex protein 11 homolog [Prionailurus bengalensis]
MPDVEEKVPLKDPGDAECGSCKPEASAPTGENESGPKDHPPCPIDTVDNVSKLNNNTGMNRDFHMEEKVLPPSSLEGKVKETMHNAFWDHLKEQLSATPPDFSCALELLKEIKEILLSLLLPRQNRLRSDIEEALDTELLKQKAEHGALDVPHLSKYILDTMTLLCAPVRDEAVQKLENITDPVWLLRGIFQVLGLMKMDMVNYTIQSLQPHLQEHSIQHERATFQELLNKQPSLLSHTTKWLTQAAADLTTPLPTCPDTSDSASVASSSPSEAAISPEPLSPTMVLSQGFLNLLLWDPEDEDFPETLLTDRTQLQELESQLSQLTILASVLLVASSFSGSVLFGSPQFVDKLKHITKDVMEEFKSRPEEAMQTVSEQVSQEIHQSLKNMGLAALSSENTASLIGQLQNIAKKENCVRSVIDQRIHLFLKCCLVLGVQRSLLDLPGGLTVIEAELAELGQKFVSLTHRNQKVFGPYYTEILKTLIPPAQALETEVESL